MVELDELDDPEEKVWTLIGNLLDSKFSKFIIYKNGLTDIGNLGIPVTCCNKRVDFGAIFASLDNWLIVIAEILSFR